MTLVPAAAGDKQSIISRSSSATANTQVITQVQQQDSTHHHCPHSAQ
jgi:hypothetical protein